MDVQAARIATSPRGLALLESLPPYATIDPLSLGEQLRAQGAHPDVVSVALTQARLRSEGEAKFGPFAKGMVFTPAGLEQATRLVVAARHASRYRDAGIGRVADLTTGIGADAMAFAALGIGVLAFEKDEATALIADHNLRHWEDARVVHADSLATLASGAVDVDGVFADPARRTARGRRHDPRDYEPPLDEVLALRGRWSALGVKVGPGIPHDALPSSAAQAPVEAQWVSVDGDVVEAGIWCGPLAQHPGRTALVIRGDQAHLLTGSTEQAPTGELAERLLEPDGAVIRSGLIGELADRLGARLVDPAIAYLTTDAPVATPFASAFRIEEALPYSEKALAGALRARGIGSVEIKKRGMDIAPEQLRRRLRLRGDDAATVILTRVAGKRMALIARREESG
ncbi:MAG: class I SAM-dependent methyltransferase [Actinomycetes bacterium]|nr:MAG: SAM-dependent methyltransferase [Actinomycetota bacterium]